MAIIRDHRGRLQKVRKPKHKGKLGHSEPKETTVYPSSGPLLGTRQGQSSDAFERAEHPLNGDCGYRVAFTDIAWHGTA